ncbi:hypothetical protein HELRODRAFT_183378 [Helobdella robusta]|uniref:Uncharacterized protein n=1 Tax=Helobdella robusta TaxID=6412 RepID=T1FJJ1_HELRO|nr:hypothetical protein HELRODRAFT_183378 [Helobdella robusta]ESO11275.1 hypothetical protein HELRODRAFT_183378 [Helobdella robusta]
MTGTTCKMSVAGSAVVGFDHTKILTCHMLFVCDVRSYVYLNALCLCSCGNMEVSGCRGTDSAHPPSSRKRRSLNVVNANISKTSEDSRVLDTAVDMKSKSLLFIPRLILRKDLRGGEKKNISAKINSRLDAFGEGSLEELMKSVEPIIKGQDERVRKPKLSALVKCKIEQGNVRHAMRILASTDTMAPDSTNTINSLKNKHPPAPLDRKPSPNKESSSVTVNPQQIMLCLRQFPKGTSGGRDGLTPQHLRDLTHDKIETAELISAVTGFINLLLSGVCPPELEDFKHIMSMMTEIGKHDALVLLTQAAFIPRLSYFLRTSPGPSQQKSDELNNELRMGFQKIFNVFFDDKGWKQAILPVNMGGLGLFSELKFALDRVSHLSVHDALTIVRSALSLPKEPSGISVQDGKRPDGCTLTPWRAGKCLAWDVTVPGTLAERYVHLTSKECGLAAIKASDEKIKKYEHALPSYMYRGPWTHGPQYFKIY